MYDNTSVVEQTGAMEIQTLLANPTLSDTDKMKAIEKFLLEDAYKFGHVPKAVKDIDEYVNMNTWKIKSNANVSYSHGALLAHSAGNNIEDFVRYKLNAIDPNIANAHNSGDYHIHDLSLGTCCYCIGLGIKDLLLKGFGNERATTMNSKPAKHLDVALAQIVNSIYCVTGEVAGAVSYAEIDVFLAYFIKKDNLSYGEVKQALSSFVWGLSTESRLAAQQAFSNVSFSLDAKLVEDEAVIYAGEYLDFTYGDIPDYQKYVDMFNLAFIDVMMNEPTNGGCFKFPIPTYNVTTEDVFDNEVGTAICKLTSMLGTPYMANYLSTGLDPKDVRSMCCRLSLKLDEIAKHIGSAYIKSANTGSIGVVTLNLGRYGYVCSNKKELFDMIRNNAVLAMKSLEFKREFITANLDAGMYPYTKRNLGDRGFTTFFSTIGLIGGHECCVNLLGKGIDSEEGSTLMIEVLKYILTLCAEFTETTGNLYNMESTPAESTCYSLALKDKKLYGDDIFISGTSDSPYYTNSTNLPVSFTSNIEELIEHQTPLQSIYSSGTVLHCNLGERQPEPEATKNFIINTFKNYPIPYMSITPTFTICPEHGYSFGDKCSHANCTSEWDVFSRVTGYYSSTKTWNKGKQQELKERTSFVI